MAMTESARERYKFALTFEVATPRQLLSYPYLYAMNAGRLGQTLALT
ncbi:MAG: hypothetical protein LBV73_19480 [Paraburkholderia sp.]|jgi:hypothetical protein|nr:hypothetical protein [Paraburkholderia sp.]